MVIRRSCCVVVANIALDGTVFVDVAMGEIEDLVVDGVVVLGGGIVCY